MLALSGVSKSFVDGGRTRPVLTGVDARFEAGERVVITGRSGTGKSTLLNLVAGIDLPDAGTIELDGRDLTALPDRERTLVRRRQIGFVFQFFNLLPTLTVEENLLLPLELNATPPAERRERCAALLAEVGLADRGTSFPDALSGGEQQRVAVARALVHRPAVVLADEPTGNLDDASARELLAILARVARAGDSLLLMVTHSAEAAALGDRVLRLEEGALHPASPGEERPGP